MEGISALTCKKRTACIEAKAANDEVHPTGDALRGLAGGVPGEWREWLQAEKRGAIRQDRQRETRTPKVMASPRFIPLIFLEIARIYTNI